MKAIGQNVKFRVSFIYKDFGTDKIMIQNDRVKTFEQIIKIPIPTEYLDMIESLGEVMVFKKDGKYEPEAGTPGIVIQGDIYQTVFLTDIPRMGKDVKQE
jgi:hypothetical protein